MSDRINWTAPMDDKLRQFYFNGAYTSDAVGGLLGVSGNAVRARAARLRRGHPEVRIRKPGPARVPKPPRPPKVAKAKAKLLNTHRAPVNLKAPDRPSAALSDRILSALRLRAMSAPSLASELNEKEMSVSIQLAAMAHASEVQAGPALAAGPRYRIWSLAA